MLELPTITAVRQVATSRLFKIEEVDLSFSNGATRCYERMRGQRGQEAVMVIPLLEDQTLLLVREYMVGLERYELGFPKGLLEPDEEMLQGANRELAEEVGYAARELTLLARLSTAPGYLTSRMPIILARDLYPQTAAGDEPEPIEVVPWPLQDAAKLLQRDDFSEARGIAGLYLALTHLQNKVGG